jgi:predicted transcriptional regulator
MKEKPLLQRAQRVDILMVRAGGLRRRTRRRIDQLSRELFVSDRRRDFDRLRQQCCQFRHSLMLEDLPRRQIETGLPGPAHHLET